MNGNPAISYFDITNYYPKYVRASDANGSNWATAVTANSAGNVRDFCSLAVVNGKPAIGYYDYTNEDLKFACPRLD